VGVAGVYPFDVAEAKVRRTSELAEQNEFPLLTTLEPE
jgi:ATP-dependent Clp protease adaptor protein ClpS